MTRSVLITGCSSGIGKTLALGLKARGFRVFATARKQADLDALTQLGLEALPLDLNNPNSIKNLASQVLEKTNNQLDVLINNAAYAQPGAVEDLSFALMQEQFAVNVFGTIALTNEFIPQFRQHNHGRIINISSILGIITLAYRGNYNASKFALEGFTDTLRLELSNTNIKISLIEPGAVESQFRANAYQAFEKNLSKSVSVHSANYDNYVHMVKEHKKFGSKAPFMQSPESVLKKVIAAIESKNPKIRYTLGLPAFGLRFLKRILPDKWMDQILLKISSGELQKKD